MKITIDKIEPPKRFKKIGKLPGRPSKLILLALKDLIAAEKAGYEIDMRNWHKSRNGKCAVCFAGSVMAMSLNAPANKSLASEEFPDENNALGAINEFRLGNTGDAFYCLDLPLPGNIVNYVQVALYEDDPDAFKKDMKDLAKALEKEGY